MCVRPGGGPPTHSSMARGCGDGGTEREPSMAPTMLRPADDHIVQWTFAVAATNRVGPLVWSCCADWKRDRMKLYMNAASALGGAFLLALTILVSTHDPMPGWLSRESVILWI